MRKEIIFSVRQRSIWMLLKVTKTTITSPGYIIVQIIGGLLVIILIAMFIGMIVKYIKFQKMMHSDEETETPEKKNYIKTEGHFTGKVEENPTKIVRGRAVKAGYKEYEVSFIVDGEMYNGWYHFHPAPDPMEIPEGHSVKVSYQKGKPWNFEIDEIKWDW